MANVQQIHVLLFHFPALLFPELAHGEDGGIAVGFDRQICTANKYADKTWFLLISAPYSPLAPAVPPLALRMVR